MKILMINVVCGIRSTGRICTDLATELEGQGHEVKIAYGREDVPEKFQKYAMRIGNNVDVKCHGVKTRFGDSSGFGSKRVTADFLKWATRYKPDVLWLHNLHGYYINIEMLFEWIKNNPDMEVRWTLHDCWAFTGHCSHFSFVNCNKWLIQCENCVQKKEYPKSIFLDRSKRNYERKKKAFTGVKNMTIITPSKWLADLVKKSYLGEYPIETHYNKIDTTAFRPTPSLFKKDYGIENKKMVLGVASSWNERKGLYDFYRLSEMLDEEYAIVLVGLSEKQIKNLPRNIVGIKQTNSVSELAAIYTAADVFVNPSKEETFGLTTIEALSCGTKAIVYKGTACEEIVDIYGGVAVNPDVESLYKEIIESAKSKFY